MPRRILNGSSQPSVDSAEVASAPPYRLYLPRHVLLATCVAGPLGAAATLALNYWRLGRPGAAWLVLGGLGIGGTAFVFVIYSLGDPNSNNDRVVSTLMVLFTYQLAKVLLGRAYREHWLSGGLTASWWSAGAIGVASFLPLLCPFTILEIVGA